MKQKAVIEEGPLDLILARTLDRLKNGEHLDEATFARIQSVIQERKLANRSAVVSALKLPEENGE